MLQSLKPARGCGIACAVWEGMARYDSLNPGLLQHCGGEARPSERQQTNQPRDKFSAAMQHLVQQRRRTDFANPGSVRCHLATRGVPFLRRGSRRSNWYSDWGGDRGSLREELGDKLLICAGRRATSSTAVVGRWIAPPRQLPAGRVVPAQAACHARVAAPLGQPWQVRACRPEAVTYSSRRNPRISSCVKW